MEEIDRQGDQAGSFTPPLEEPTALETSEE
jgi:hypothetical protein